MNQVEIESSIPHRKPFLFVDRVLELTDSNIVAQACPRSDDVFWKLVYQGHYPNQPVTPGVLLCEIVFQAGALLMAHRLGKSDGVPLLTRINQTKFRLPVFPDELLEVSSAVVEELGPATFLQGKIKKTNQVALQVEYAVTLKSEI